MQVTPYGHACVEVTAQDARLVLDPGAFSQLDGLAPPDDVLVTHEHGDHLDHAWLRRAAAARPQLRIWTNSAVADLLGDLADRVTVVGNGDTFTTSGGLEVEVHGEWHAQIHPDIPRVHNVGFLVAGSLFHPGDALTDPGRTVQTLLVPLHGPWSKSAEIIDYVRTVRPGRAVPVHDALLTPTGQGLVDGLLTDRGPGTGVPYLRLPVGVASELA